MLIANPIYDGVFKYLMEDEESAKMLLSAITDQEIISIQFIPREHTGKVNWDSCPITVYRMDFAAIVKTSEGPKKILIELQKAKYAADIMRFRKYLGEQYAKEQDGEPMPIITIYFLGYSLDHHKTPVIKVKRKYEDLTTKEELNKKEDFIESLTHDSYIIQIPYLSSEYRTELEALLSIFDQNRRYSKDRHTLIIDEEGYPEGYKRLVRRLVKATAQPEIKKKMDIEDEFLGELESMERRIYESTQILKEKENELKESHSLVAEKENQLKESHSLVAEKENQLKESHSLMAEKENQLKETHSLMVEKENVIRENQKRLAEKDRALREMEARLEELLKQLPQN